MVARSDADRCVEPKPMMELIVSVPDNVIIVLLPVKVPLWEEKSMLPANAATGSTKVSKTIHKTRFIIELLLNTYGLCFFCRSNCVTGGFRTFPGYSRAVAPGGLLVSILSAKIGSI